MGIKTVPQPPYSQDLAPCDFWLFPKLRGCRCETIEEMKEAVTKVIEMLTQEDFHGAFQKLLEQYNKCIAAEGDYFEGDWSFMHILSIKVPIRKKSGNLFNDPRICVCVCVWERERESGYAYMYMCERERKRICIYVFVCVRERERKKNKWINVTDISNWTWVTWNFVIFWGLEREKVLQ